MVVGAGWRGRAVGRDIVRGEGGEGRGGTVSGRARAGEWSGVLAKVHLSKGDGQAR